MPEKRTIVDPKAPDGALLALLGERLAGERLRLDLTQAQLADEAGVSRSTVRRLEAGESTQLTNFIRVLRVLGLTANLDALVPATPKRPLESLERGGRSRQRASGKRTADGERKRAGGRPFVWGEDR